MNVFAVYLGSEDVFLLPGCSFGGSEDVFFPNVGEFRGVFLGSFFEPRRNYYLFVLVFVDWPASFNRLFITKSTINRLLRKSLRLLRLG